MMHSRICITRIAHLGDLIVVGYHEDDASRRRAAADDVADTVLTSSLSDSGVFFGII